jgi:hypothetical protein
MAGDEGTAMIRRKGEITRADLRRNCVLSGVALADSQQ